MNKFYIYPGNYSNVIREGLLRRENWVEEDNKSSVFATCNFVWKPTNLSVTGYNRLDAAVRSRSKNLVQVFNHFENIRGICTKTGLIRSLKKFYQRNKEAKKIDYSVFDSTPTSYIITAGVDDHEHALFIARFRQLEKQNFASENTPQKHCLENFWLVKPANLNQGKGIKMFKSLKDIHTFLNEKTPHSFWVVQKYIEKPLLYYGRKFDIRVWAVVTNKFEIFVYKKSYIRTSSDNFDLDNKNTYVHLTNNCLQQFGDNYGKHEDGNTLPLETLDKYFEEAFPGKNVTIETHVIPRIKDLIIDTMLCTKNDLNPNHRPNIFEFFGFDFLIDEDMRTWLIEVNTNPYLGTPNEYIGNLLPKMVDDMLELTADNLFTPKKNPKAGRANDYELIYCEGGSKHHNGPLNVRSQITNNIYPLRDLAPTDAGKKLAAAERVLEAAKLKSSQVIQPKVVNTGDKDKKQKEVEQSKSAGKQEASKPLSTEKPVILEQSGNHDQPKSSEQPEVKEVLLNQDQPNEAASPLLGANGQDTDDEKDIQKIKEEAEEKMQEDGYNSNDELEKVAKMGQRASEGKKIKNTRSHRTNIEAIFKGLHLASIYKTQFNIENLRVELGIILSCLKNWELISENQGKITCQSLVLLAQSSANYLLAEEKPLNTLAGLLKSSNVRLDFKLAIIEAVYAISKEITLKKKLICSKLIHELIRICIHSCDEREIQNYNKPILTMALKSLINLGVGFFKRALVLPEAIEFEKTSSSFMAQGGLIAIWLVGNHSLDYDMREIALKNFLVKLDYKSLERQLQILQILKIIPEVGSENEDSDYEEANRLLENASNLAEAKTPHQDEIVETRRECDISTIQYEQIFINDTETQDKTNNLRSCLFEKDRGISLSFPKSLFKIYSLEKLLSEFADFFRSFTEAYFGKENEEAEKRLMAELEKQKRIEEKEQQNDENRKSALLKSGGKSSKSKTKLQQLQVYQKPKGKDTSLTKQPDVSEKVRILQNLLTARNQNYQRGQSEERKKEQENLESSQEHGTGKFAADVDGEMEDSKKRTAKAPSLKYKFKEEKNFRIVSKPSSNSAQKYASSATFKPPRFSQTNDFGSDSELASSQILQQKSNIVTNYLPNMKVNSTEKRIRPSLPVDIARLRQTENVFSKDSTYYKNDKKQFTSTLSNANNTARDQSQERKEALRQLKNDYMASKKMLNLRNLNSKITSNNARK